MHPIQDTVLNDELLIRQSLKKAVPYEEYSALVAELAAAGQTTGEDQKPSLVDYTYLNNRRMRRWEKTLKLPQALVQKLSELKRDTLWLVLTESWCGDGAPTIPAMDKIAAVTPKLELKVILRNEHPELMERFRTNGTLSIPKLLSIDLETFEVTGQWGPRPEEANAMAEAYKEEHGSLSASFREDLQRWYNADKGKATLRELLNLLPLE